MSNIQIEQHAFVLHSRPFKENQQLVELLTENEGKVSALVYVGQSKRSIKKGMIQSFLPLKLIYKGNDSGLKRISVIESTGNSYALSKNRLYCGFYINELLVRLLTNDIVCDGLFQQYQLTLGSLANNLPIAPQLRQFELSLLAELGLSFDFSPVLSNTSDNIVGFYYIADEGFVPAYNYSIANISTPWFKIAHLRAIAHHIIHGAALEQHEAEQTFKLLMRNVINHLLDGKPLNSRKLFEKR
ncbi:DNA repair protein RecO [Colwellia sp. MSW7]|jgi:DNA repair protein RecO (recombination protein O)|uniref:DNA repair protein RecO n=1 Tax=Colwellia maritima TaxID=2912588 RepID=A0ABS9WZE1_9GAMM|nr:DNA repair protein RecO [Colwellia maritima]MCI2283284.1 DNA repair protein RecO [Colwellia maritima]